MTQKENDFLMKLMKVSLIMKNLQSSKDNGAMKMT